MNRIQERVDALLEAIDNWLYTDNEHLADAIDRTAKEGYFSFEDIQFAIEAIKENISREALTNWMDHINSDSENSAEGQNVLCLHAGNIPLVGFQDALTTLLSGARYTGKISRKDPYLLPTFLNEVKQMSLWSDMDVQWTHRLNDFEGMAHDAVIFAGSESSVPGVKEAIQQYDLANEETRYLIRTAHFSIAFLDRVNSKSMQDLASSILRYGGKGCRSVAIVVSPYELEEVKEELVESTKSFWSENPQHETPAPRLKHQVAYNEAVERNQLWLEYFLIQEEGIELDQDFVCYWVQGDEKTVAQCAEKYQDDMQSIYVTDQEVSIPGWESNIELLENAQTPKISWQPDDIDTLVWLMR
ncbi:acyl-CoA reductase [Fodinibius saliphilus]|uniref:acyl-CoA reductase n=1 Tax=Fodinibius saliphilus TaxID=1920650 RepID=UPI001109F60A|nr:acyl-CoA reductase [Fodinibius saliphilus]